MSAKLAFPLHCIEDMIRAMRRGGDGAVAKCLCDARQVWEANLPVLLASIDPLEAIRQEAHPIAYRILRKHGCECRTRFRPYPHCYDGRVNGNGMCVLNSITEALDTGKELWSGYSCFVGKTSWHLWNVDLQGYVHDVTYGIESVFCRYYGIRIDPYLAHEIITEKSANLLEAMFLYWPFFESYLALLKNKHGVTDSRFANLAEELCGKIRI